jgi:hypothetical protein
MSRSKSGLDASLNRADPQYGTLWAITAVWVDVNNDGLLDLFVVNYMQWEYSDKALCAYEGVTDYCHPKFYKGQPNQLFLNNANGTFRDVSKKWGVRDHVGKGMGIGMADYDLDGKPDLFVTNDASYNSLHNAGNKFEEVAFETGVALVEDGSFVSGMGVDFSRLQQRWLPGYCLCGVAELDVSNFSEHRKKRVQGSHNSQRHARSEPTIIGVRGGTVRLR